LVADGDGNVFVTNQLGTIGKITPASVVTTIAGATGSSTARVFSHPAGIVIDGAGNLYLADYSGYVIHKITFQ
jgi:streptogramin lyase